MAKKKRKSQVEDGGDGDASGATATKSVANDEFIVVLPGDNVTSHISNSTSAAVVHDDDGHQPNNKDQQLRSFVLLGSGLRWSDDGENESSKQDEVFATTAGRLECRKSGGNKSVFFVRPNHKRYQELHPEDRVVGIVEDRMGSDGAGGDLYRINIGASHPAMLSNLSGFEGATKRNKPHLQPGQVLYARVTAPSYPTATCSGIQNHGCGILDPVLSCQLGPHDGNLPRKDWMTTETLYGILKGGTVCRISTGLARSLLHPDSVVLSALAQAKPSLAFEVAVGVNGFLWIHSTAPEYTILIQNAICNSNVLTPAQVRGMVKQLVYTVRKEMQKDQDGGGTSSTSHTAMEE